MGNKEFKEVAEAYEEGVPVAGRLVDRPERLRLRRFPDDSSTEFVDPVLAHCRQINRLLGFRSAVECFHISMVKSSLRKKGDTTLISGTIDRIIST